MNGLRQLGVLQVDKNNQIGDRPFPDRLWPDNER